ncbi:Transposon Ty3-G Gag-Pol polyprotein [Labeo rohita]|uniref:ribonuclease H n=1 Tax=Labeo rohita TaxID=84645 RepID=A0ABQ8LAC3_LABRO|nr:Transposon Ty3-G Gag-Pol polyprotein [Labeo rohita]
MCHTALLWLRCVTWFEFYRCSLQAAERSFKPRLDRSHRSLTPKKPNGKLRVIIANLHYYQDCVEVLRRAREQGPLRYKGEPNAIFPDYTASVARAWAAFNDGDSKDFLDPEKAMAYVRSMIQNEETANRFTTTLHVGTRLSDQSPLSFIEKANEIGEWSLHATPLPRTYGVTLSLPQTSASDIIAAVHRSCEPTACVRNVPAFLAHQRVLTTQFVPSSLGEPGSKRAISLRSLRVIVPVWLSDRAFLDGHDRCLTCLGRAHAEAAFVDGSCAYCERMSIATLRSRLSFARRLPSSSSRRSSSSRKGEARRLGDLQVTVQNVPPGKTPRASAPPRGPVVMPKQTAPPSTSGPSVSFGAPLEEEMSISASEGERSADEEHASAERRPSAVAAPSEVDAELSAMLLWAAEGIGLEVPKVPPPDPSRLDDWFLGTRSVAPPRSPPVPFFPEVHDELVRAWRALIRLVRVLPPQPSLPLMAGGQGVRGGPSDAATWRGSPRLPSKACRLLSALTGRAYSAAGQAATVLHAMATLQVYQAKALKELHKGSPDQAVKQELRAATDFALRATKVTARSLGQVMSTLMVQERHLWLNLAQMADVDKARFPDAPGLCPAGVPLRPPRSKNNLLRLRLRPMMRPSPPDVVAATGERRCPLLRGPPKPIPADLRGAPDTGSPEMMEAALRGTTTSAPPLPEEGRDLLCVQPPSTYGSAVPTHSQKEHFSTSLGQVPWDLFLSDKMSPRVWTRNQHSPAREPGKKSKFRGILFTSVCSDTDASVLRAEIAVLLAKDAIEPVPPAEMKSGFYSPYFIVPKKSGGLRPILDVITGVLNRSLLRLPFKMLTSKRILSCVRHQDWFAAIDLKDAYFHISILPRHRPFLRFAFEGRAYQYKVLPFGLSLSPRIFTKVAEGALNPLWRKGIHILNYLDDWLIMAHSRDLLCEHRDLVLQHLCSRWSIHQEASTGREVPQRPHLVPSWDLSVALRDLRGPPFEPLVSVELKFLSLKTALLTALASIKRVGDLQAFSVNEACLEFGPADSHVVQRPRPSYVPKVPTTPFRDQVVNLQALPPEEADPALALLCPVRALRVYVDRTRSFRRSEQLFVCFGGQQKGNAVSKQRLAHWVVDAISLAYESQGEPCPLGVRAHSECCLLCAGARRLASRHLQSCGLGDT